MGDTTDHNQTEKTLCQSEQRFRALFETMVLGVVFQDADGKITFANSAAESLLGLTTDQMTVRKPTDPRWRTIHEDGSDFPGDTHPSMLALMTGKEVRGVRMGVYNPNLNEHRWLNVSAIPLFRPGEDKPYEVYTTFDDVTDLVKLKEDLLRSLEDTKRERDRLQALEEVAEAGLSSLDRQQLLDVLVKHITAGMKAHSGHIMLLDEAKGELVAQAVFNVPGQFETRIDVNEGFVGMVHKKRGTVYVADISQDPRVTDPCLNMPEIKSVLGTPITIRGKFLGVLYVNMIEVYKFSNDDWRLIEGMAAAVANAVENARLFDESKRSRQDTEESLDKERHLSLLMQRALLPQIPSISEEYRVALKYLPVFESREIGGDFYDVFETPDDKIGVMVGDVSGKGLEAASLAATTRSTVHAFAHEMHSAGEVLTKADSVLSYRGSPFDQFATLFFAVLDLASGEMSYASAGHPPGMICRADGRVELLKFGNVPLGMMEGWNYSESWNHLDRGDKLVLYTDGISEAHHDTEMFDIDGIYRVLEERSYLLPEELVTEILAAASQWAEGKLTDDAAILILERLSEHAGTAQDD